VSAWLVTTERLAARPKRANDATPLHAVFGDTEVMQHLGGPIPTLARTQDFVAQHIAHQQTHGFSMWTLIEQATAEVIGDVGFLADEGGVEIGWHLRRTSWGQGYATEAARACLVYPPRSRPSSPSRHTGAHPARHVPRGTAYGPAPA
jgi:RimJ/RimL family protein N-acetyltransferase